MRSILALAACASTVVASSGVMKLDFARRAIPQSQFAKRSVEAALANDLTVQRYTIDATIGTPPQMVNLILDTGSSDVWVASSNSSACAASPSSCPHGTFDAAKSSSYQPLGIEFNQTYGTVKNPTEYAGPYFTDTLGFGNASLSNHTMGLVDLHKESAGVSSNQTWGIFGIGYPGGQNLDQLHNQTYPTVWDSLLSAGYIARRLFSLYLDDVSSSTGSLLFGGIDTTKYSGELVSFPVQQDNDGFGPQYLRYLVALTGVSFSSRIGSAAVVPDNYTASALLDSGNQRIDLPEKYITEILTGLGGTVQDSMPLVDCALRQVNATFDFEIGGPTGLNISVPLSELILPHAITSNETTKNGVQLCELMVAPSTSIALGDPFLRSAYAIFDLDNNVIALAQASYNSTGEDIVPVSSGVALPSVTMTNSLTLSVTAEGAGVTASGSAATSAVISTSAAGGSSAAAGSPTFALGTTLATTTPSATASSSSGSSSAGFQVTPLVSISLAASLLTGLLALVL